MQNADCRGLPVSQIITLYGGGEQKSISEVATQAALRISRQMISMLRTVSLRVLIHTHYYIRIQNKISISFIFIDSFRLVSELI